MAMKLNKIRSKLLSDWRSLPRFLRPRDYEKSLINMGSNLNRTPKILSEKYFVNLFKKEEYINEAKSISPEMSAIQSRSLAVSCFEKKGIFSFNRRISNAVTLLMDDQLNLKGVKVKPIPIDELPFVGPQDTSSGYPDNITPKGENIHHVVSQIKEIIKDTNLDYLTWLPFFYTQINFRIQARVSGVKKRMIYAVPHLIQSIERLFAQPFFDYFHEHTDTAFAFGWKFSQKAKLWRDLQKYPYIVSIDIDNFDLSIQQDLLYYMLQYIKTKINFTYKWQNYLFKIVVSFILDSNFVTKIDEKLKIVRKRNGLLSGLVFTNFLGSLVNLFMVMYYLVDHGMNPLTKIAVCGDDIVFGSNIPVDLKQLTDYYKRKFDIVVSESKSQVFTRGEDIFFLGFYFNDKTIKCDVERMKVQLCINQRFIPEAELPTSERLISKLASICESTEDSKDFFDEVAKQICKDYGLSQLPKYYYELIDRGVGDYKTLQSFSEFREKWRDR